VCPSALLRNDLRFWRAGKTTIITDLSLMIMDLVMGTGGTSQQKNDVNCSAGFVCFWCIVHFSPFFPACCK
jgi:hypothetical protein